MLCILSTLLLLYLMILIIVYTFRWIAGVVLALKGHVLETGEFEVTDWANVLSAIDPGLRSADRCAQMNF